MASSGGNFIITGNVGIGTTAASTSSALAVFGGASIGAAYVATAAPSEGLLVQGNVGIGTNNPANTLAVSGGASIGAAYVGTAAPSGGLLVQGNVGIGTTVTAASLHVQHVGNGDIFRVDDVAGNDTTPLIVKADGNVGIGTLIPTALLHVNGNIQSPTFVGQIAYFAMTTAPTGWLECKSVPAVSRTTYAALFAAIGTVYGSGDGSSTFNLPELRGEFIRGWDNGRTIDNNRAFASSQLDAFQGHYHQLWGDNDMGAGIAGGGFRVYRDSHLDSTLLPSYSPHVRAAVTDGTNNAPRTAAETRPRNIALLVCIKC